MEWVRFEYKAVQRIGRGGLMIVTQHNMRSWIGVPVECNQRGVILVNGADEIHLYFEGLPNARFCILHPPGGVTFGIGEHRLALGD